MTIYYFVKRRFPRKEARVELRAIFDQHGRIPEEILADDKYFEDFKLSLSGNLPDAKNKFSGLNYATLGDYKVQFDLRPLRNIVVKQNSPTDDDSAMYEVFNRLNTGGVNLRPQEIRTSMYHSSFYEMLYRVNNIPEWRRILNRTEPDIHMKDIEILLRSFAMLIDGDIYAPSLVRFLNRFSKKSERNDPEKNGFLEALFKAFIESCFVLLDGAFINPKNGRFNVALFEAVFAAACSTAFAERRLVEGMIDPAHVAALADDPKFTEASQEGTTRTANVSERLTRAKLLIPAL